MIRLDLDAGQLKAELCGLTFTTLTMLASHTGITSMRALPAHRRMHIHAETHTHTRTDACAHMRVYVKHSNHCEVV